MLTSSCSSRRIGSITWLMFSVCDVRAPSKLVVVDQRSMICVRLECACCSPMTATTKNRYKKKDKQRITIKILFIVPQLRIASFSALSLSLLVRPHPRYLFFPAISLTLYPVWDHIEVVNITFSG